MSETITAQFTSRREAETAVEHLVQEHGIDRNAVEITAAEAANTAGTRAAGSDTENGREKTGTEGAPALEGRIRVAATVEGAKADEVRSSFAAYGGQPD